MNHPRSRLRVLAASTLCAAALLSACSDPPEALLDSARHYLEKNDHKAAIIQIKNALQANPELPQARFLLGRALHESGDAAGAEAELRKALALQHPKDAVVPLLAQVLVAQGKAKEVTDTFAGMQLGQASAQADLQLSLANAYAQQDLPERAEALLAAALQTDPGYAPALLEQARKRAGQKDFEGAQGLIDTVLAKAPDSHAAWKLKADIHALGQHQPDDALRAYRKAVAIKPDFWAAQTALVMLLLQQEQLDGATSALAEVQKIAPGHPQTQYLAALLAFQKKDFKVASDLVQQSLKVAPGSAASLQLAGAAALQLHNLPQARDFLEKAVAGAPGLPLARRLLVVTYLRTRQPAKALAALLPGLTQSPPDPALVALAGEVYLQNGKLNQAEEYFLRANLQKPGDGRRRTSLALVKMMRSPSDTGFEELRDISASDTGTTADMALISAHIQRREFDQALQAIDVLEKKQPTHPVAPYLRARVLLAKNDMARARSNFERAVTLEPTYFPAVAALAAMDLADKKPVEARKRLDALLRKDPGNTQALLALADLAAKTGAPADEVARLLGNAIAADPTEPGLRLLLIDFHLRNKDAKGAVAAAHSAVAALPGEPRLLDALGRSQQISGDLNQAMASYRKLAELLPLSPLPYWRLADAQLGNKDKDAAIHSLRKALGVQPDFLDGQRALVALYMADQRSDEALDIARSVQKQRPKEDTGYLLEGDIRATGKQWDHAATALRSGLQHVSTTPLAMKLHTVLQSAGKGAEADRFSTQWQKEHPKDAAYAFYLGDLAFARQDFATAEKHYAAVVRQQANNAVALNNLAWVSAKLKRAGAIGYAEKALALAPNQPTFLDTLATLRSEKGDYAQAVELQNRALTLQPNNGLLKLNLARIHLRAGKKELAKQPLEELRALGDAFAGQSEVGKLLKELGVP